MASYHKQKTSKGEALALTWDKINLEKGNVYISVSLTRKVEGMSWEITPKNQVHLEPCH
jgi:hypothetical protein